VDTADESARHPPDRIGAVYEALPVLVTTHALDGHGTYTGVYTGLQVKATESPKDLVGRRLSDVLTDEATDRLLATFAEAAETGARQYVEHPVEFGGESFWRGAYVAPLAYGEGGDVEEVVAAGFDLTRQRERSRVLYDVLDALETNASRADLEAAFCDLLVERGRYELAWIGTRDDGEVCVRASAGAASYLEAIAAERDGLAASGDVAVQALRTGDRVAVNPITAAATGDWGTVATEQGLQAAVAVPLRHDGVDHGVLAVYLSDAEYLVPWREAVLEHFADAAGYALSAAMWQWALAAETAAVVEVDIDARTPLAALCSVASPEGLTVEAIVPREGETGYYLAPAREWRVDPGEAAAETAGVEPYGDGADGPAGVVVDRETPERELLAHGVRVSRFAVTPDGLAITARAPSGDAVRAALASLREGYDGVSLSVQWGDTADAPVPSCEVNVAALCTDRQYEVLQAAYRHGYFDPDRSCNLTDLADVVGLSRWTVSEHLDRAQQALFASLLD